jgi:hypothetical protein
MTNQSIAVTCGQCQNFVKHDRINQFSDDNGRCSKWDEFIKNRGILANSQFFVHKLGGREFNSEIERNCLMFTGKHVFVVGE